MSNQAKAPKELLELTIPSSGDSADFLKKLLDSVGHRIKLEKAFWGKKNWTVKDIKLNMFNFKESMIILTDEKEGEEVPHQLESFIHEFQPKVEM
jgi:hypothetical protein